MVGALPLVLPPPSHPARRAVLDLLLHAGGTDMRCPKCKRGRLRQHVSVFVDCDADTRSLSKKGIRSKDVKVMGAGWPTALLYCPKCAWMEKLKGDGS